MRRPRRISVSKVPTTPQARELGTVESLRRTLKELGAEGAAVDYVGHGMTTATNAVIQRTRRQDRLRHDARLPRSVADRAPGPAEPLRHRCRAHAAAGAARALLRRRRPSRCRGARDRAALDGRPGGGRRRHARPRRRSGCRGLPARLCQPRARARGQGRARAAPARRRRLHLDRHPARVPRVRARQHDGAQRLPDAGHDQVPRLAVGPAARSGRGPRHRPRQADHGDGGLRRADDRGVGAGASRCTRCCRGRPAASWPARMSPAWSGPTPSSPWTSAAPAPTSA